MSSLRPSSLANLSKSLASLRAVRIETLAASPSLLARLLSSIRLSSVSGGTLIINTSPLLVGFNPRLALIMPVAIGSSMGFSQG